MNKFLCKWRNGLIKRLANLDLPGFARSFRVRSVLPGYAFSLGTRTKEGIREDVSAAAIWQLNGFSSLLQRYFMCRKVNGEDDEPPFFESQ
jgi:hypothetical protein